MKKSSNEPRIPMTRPQIIRLLQEYPDLAHKILKMLPKKEAYIMGNLYGIQDSGVARRPADLAREMGITLSRVYQLRRHGLILICHPARKQIIVEYIMTHIVKKASCKTKQIISNRFE